MTVYILVTVPISFSIECQVVKENDAQLDTMRKRGVYRFYVLSTKSTGLYYVESDKVKLNYDLGNADLSYHLQNKRLKLSINIMVF